MADSTWAGRYQHPPFTYFSNRFQKKNLTENKKLHFWIAVANCVFFYKKITFQITRQIKKMCRVSARKLSIYNFAWRLLKASNLQAEFKILKKYWNTKSINQNQKFQKKNCVSYLKSGKRPKICLDGICRPNPKP
jgi:hypothetical protein